MSKKPQVFYGLDKVEKPVKKEVPYKKTLALSYTTVYNTETNTYDLLTVSTNLETLESESVISTLRGVDTFHRAIYELQKIITEEMMGRNK
jgi:hypothetical protein